MTFHVVIINIEIFTYFWSKDLKITNKLVLNFVIILKKKFQALVYIVSNQNPTPLMSVA